MSVLVTGSRGRVGSALVALLHNKGLAVRSSSRTPEQADLPAGVDSVVCDLGDPATFAPALDGIESVFLYADPTRIDAFIEQAQTAGVRHIVLLSSSSVLGPPESDSPIAALHRSVETALEAAAVETTFLRPGNFATNALQWSHAIRTTGSVDLPYPGSYLDSIHEADLAEAAFAVLTQPDLRGSAHHLTGPQALTFAEQVAVLGRATGRELTVNAVTPAAWREAMGAHMPAEIMDALLGYWEAQDGIPPVITDGVERLTGHPGRTFAEWAADHVDAFRS